MNEIILPNASALGCVKDYLIRYELQHRGLLHAHIILWIEDDDIERLMNEITALVPTTYDNKKEESLNQRTTCKRKYSGW